MAVENAGPVILTVQYPRPARCSSALRSRSRLPRVFVPDHNQTGRLDIYEVLCRKQRLPGILSYRVGLNHMLLTE
jgi:hypothetical protein